MDFKLSYYNNKIIVCNHTIIYNSFSGKSVLIRNCRLSSWNDLERLFEKDSSLKENLIKSGIIINKEINEIEELEKRVLDGLKGDGEYVLHINPTLDCNFRCWYCYENHIVGSQMDENILSMTNDYISRVVERRGIKKINISFFGGEPLLYFNKVAKRIILHADKVCKSLDKILHVSFTSNGYALSDDIIDFLVGYSCGFQITLDGGKSHHDSTRFTKNGTGSYDRIVSNINKLAENGIKVIVRINYTSKNIRSVRSIYNSFSNLENASKEYISFDFQRVWQDRGSELDETEALVSEIRSFFVENGFIVHSNYIPKEVRFPCYGDKENYLLINYNGDVFGCTARDFTKDNRIGFLSHNGEVMYDIDKLNKRKASKFGKSICKTCRIAPLCGGSCIQKSYESENIEECTLGYNEGDKDNVVINVLDWTISNKIQ